MGSGPRVVRCKSAKIAKFDELGNGHYFFAGPNFNMSNCRRVVKAELKHSNVLLLNCPLVSFGS